MKTKIKNKAKQYFIGFLLVLIGGLAVNVYKEGKKMWQEVTEINQYTENYFKNGEAIRKQEQPVIVSEESRERREASTVVASKTPEVAVGVVSEKSTPQTSLGSLEEKILKEFNGDKVALAIARAESGLNHKQPSTTDFTADGHPFSIGLFQVNLTWNKVGGVDCTKAFNGKDKKAVVVDEELYTKCVKLASDPDKNIAAAKEIKKSGSWTRWGAYTNGSYKDYL